MFRNVGKKEDYKETSNYNNKLYVVEWDYQPIMKEIFDSEGNPTGQYEEDEVFASWMQETFKIKPELHEIEAMILEYLKSETDNKILTGFAWTSASGESINVYLSAENQFNYKAAYDLAYQTNGASLPFRLKFGEMSNPQYHDFTDMAEFTDFYYKCLGYITTCLQEGWNKKDSIDWNKYKFE